jgi:hypothetical protein
MENKNLTTLETKEHDEDFGRRPYDESNGNGWSRYQIMVLQQLTDHTKLLQALMSEVNNVKQQIAISDIVSKHWRDQADKSIDELKEDIEFIFDDEKGLNSRVRTLEENSKIEEKSTMKVKAFWGIIGGGFVIAADLLIKVYNLLSDKIKL